MIEEILPYIMPIVSLIIALILYALVQDNLRFSSDAEKAAALICLIACSIIFYQIFILFALLVGLVFMFTYVGLKIYAVHQRSKLERVGRLHPQRRRRGVYIQPRNYTVAIRESRLNTSKDEEIDVSDLSLKMDLTEE